VCGGGGAMCDELSLPCYTCLHSHPCGSGSLGCRLSIVSVTYVWSMQHRRNPTFNALADHNFTLLYLMPLHVCVSLCRAHATMLHQR